MRVYPWLRGRFTRNIPGLSCYRVLCGTSIPGRLFCGTSVPVLRLMISAGHLSFSLSRDVLVSRVSYISVVISYQVTMYQVQQYRY